jgi:hypothetical protein
MNWQAQHEVGEFQHRSSQNLSVRRQGAWGQDLSGP